MTDSDPGPDDAPDAPGAPEAPVAVPLLLDTVHGPGREADDFTPRDRAAFFLGWEAGMLTTSVMVRPDARIRWPIHAANRARLLAACNVLRRRVTFEPICVPARVGGVHGQIVGCATGMLAADIRPRGWTPADDAIAESAGGGAGDGANDDAGGMTTE